MAARHHTPHAPLPRRLAVVAVLAAFAALLAVSPALAATETKFTISGRGWGHGIGMSQWGAYGYAKHGWSHRQILSHYYTGISFGAKSNSIVRVLLRNGLSSAKVTCAYPYTASDGVTKITIPARATATITYVSGTYRVATDATPAPSPSPTPAVFKSAVTFTPSQGSIDVRTPTDMRDTGLYRGTIRVALSGSKLSMINLLRLETYLRGVLPREVSPSWPTEALKAQACAARAYAARSLTPSQPFDVYCDTRDQVYTGADGEDARTNAALSATAGVVPTYGGSVISAFYFSSSGGRTESIEYGWPGAAPVAYLKGVSDPYDSYATLHTWGPLTRTQSSATSALGSAVQGTLRAIYVVRRGTSPRIVKAAIAGTAGISYMDGNKLRMKLGLNSTWAGIRSMAVSPAQADKKIVAAGTGVTLNGRTYPGLAAGAAVTLNSYYDGAWHKRTVKSSRGSVALAGGYTAYYSSYKATVIVGQTTKFFWSYGAAASPVTTITVK